MYKSNNPRPVSNPDDPNYNPTNNLESPQYNWLVDPGDVDGHGDGSAIKTGCNDEKE